MSYSKECALNWTNKSKTYSSSIKNNNKPENRRKREQICMRSCCLRSILKRNQHRISNIEDFVILWALFLCAFGSCGALLVCPVKEYGLLLYNGYPTKYTHSKTKYVIPMLKWHSFIFAFAPPRFLFVACSLWPWVSCHLFPLVHRFNLVSLNELLFSSLCSLRSHSHCCTLFLV